MTDVVVLGSNFGGLTAALAVKAALKDDVTVTVISPSERFVFNPSLIWLPFGLRDADDVSFPVDHVLDDHGIGFVHAAADGIDPAARVVTAAGSSYAYDYLVIATGYKNNYEVVDGGIGIGGNAATITSLPDAEDAGRRWTAFLEDPSDIVVGATQGASCFGAAYEFLFNASYQIKKHGLRDKVKITYVTAEPFLGHFGIGGLPNGEKLLSMFLKKEHITAVCDMAVDHIDDGAVTLADGVTLPFGFSMFVPPFVGQDVVAASGLADAKGYVPVLPTYQHVAHPEIYAVGIAAAVTMPWTTPTPTGIPKTGFPTEVMAHVAADNIAAQVAGEVPSHEQAFEDIKAVCVMDAGNNGVIILADKMLPPRKHGVMIPGPQAHLMKLAFEKYFLWKAKHGYVSLP
jgi:sulfide:quinone oxidoreductase